MESQVKGTETLYVVSLKPDNQTLQSYFRLKKENASRHDFLNAAVWYQGTTGLRDEEGAFQESVVSLTGMRLLIKCSNISFALW